MNKLILIGLMLCALVLVSGCQEEMFAVKRVKVLKDLYYDECITKENVTLFCVGCDEIFRYCEMANYGLVIERRCKCI